MGMSGDHIDVGSPFEGRGGGGDDTSICLPYLILPLNREVSDEPIEPSINPYTNAIIAMYSSNNVHFIQNRPATPNNRRGDHIILDPASRSYARLVDAKHIPSIDVDDMVLFTEPSASSTPYALAVTESGHVFHAERYDPESVSSIIYAIHGMNQEKKAVIITPDGEVSQYPLEETNEGLFVHVPILDIVPAREIIDRYLSGELKTDSTR